MVLRRNTRNDRVRKALVGTLYSNPSALAFAALAGIIAGQTASFLTGDLLLATVANLLTAIAVARVFLTWHLPRVSGDRIALLETAWDLGACAYALATGLLAACAIAGDMPAEVNMLVACNAIGYATCVTARNAGRPVIAISQLVLAMMPCSIALIYHGGLAYWALGVTTLLLIPGMSVVTVHMNQVLRESIAAADVSSRLAEKMREVARTDAVTGLLNRAGLTHHLGDTLGRVDKDSKLACLWFDLDRFKEVNDTLGHATGDRVLAEVAHRLRAKAPSNSIIARFGGDEFIVVFATDCRSTIEIAAEDLLAEIQRPMQLDSSLLEVGTSLGVAVLPDDGADADTLMQSADLALYHSKLNGRGRVSYFIPAMTRDLMRRREIEADLRLALQRDELSVYFQPIVDLATGRIRTFEALVRWFHPEKGELHPAEFIPVAEESGAIITLGNWITAHAAKAAAGWPEDVSLAVNLSPVQIRAPGAAMAILAALRDARLPPHRLELEITETVLLDEGPQTDEFIARLSEAGVRFALDDFGTGYSSLSNLSKYHFGKIKVDRSFVSGANSGQKSTAIIRATSEMAATLDMEIVAEGLETLEQVKAVSAAGCTLGQGWYFSRAVPDYIAAMLLAEERDVPLRQAVNG